MAKEIWNCEVTVRFGKNDTIKQSFEGVTDSLLNDSSLLLVLENKESYIFAPGYWLKIYEFNHRKSENETVDSNSDLVAKTQTNAS